MSLSVGAAKTGIKRREACIISDARASLPTIYLLIARKLDFELLLSIRFGRLYLKDFPTKCEYLFFHRERIITQNTANSFATLSQRDVLRRTIGTKEKLNTKKCIKREEKISIDVITHLSWNPRKERISKGKILFTCKNKKKTKLFSSFHRRFAILRHRRNAARESPLFADGLSTLEPINIVGLKHDRQFQLSIDIPKHRSRAFCSAGVTR